MEASIVIPTYNRKDKLKQALLSLEQQDYPLDQFEVVVVSDGSNDGTHEYLQSISTPLQLKTCVQNNQGAAVARNMGIQIASGEIIIFMDDDIVAVPQLVSEHLKWHKRGDGKTVVIGPMMTPPGYKMSPWVRWEQIVLEQQYQLFITKKNVPTPRNFYTGNASLARHYLIECGGFDPTFRRAEDVELAYRIFERDTYLLDFQFNPDAVGYHYAERSFNSWLNTPYMYGRNDVIFGQQKKQNWLLLDLLREFHHRHLYNRLLVYLCLDRPLFRKGMIALMKAVMLFGAKMDWDRMTFVCCSGIFNLLYFQGMSDQLGSRNVFFERVKNVDQVKKTNG